MKTWISDDIFKTWTDAQKRLWESLCSALPFQPPAGVETWRETYLKNLTTWEKAVKQALEQEAAWVQEWVQRVANEKGAPEVMTVWVRQMEEVLQRWIQTQSQWWSDYFGMLRQRDPGWQVKSAVVVSVEETAPAPVAPVQESVAIPEPEATTTVAAPEAMPEPAVPETAAEVAAPEPVAVASAAAETVVAEAAVATVEPPPLLADEMASERAATGPAVEEAAVSAAKAPIAAMPLPQTEAAPILATAEQRDDLKTIVGIGPALEKKLNASGIFTYRQLAALNDEEIARIEAIIKATGRIRRDDWIGQARAQHFQNYGEAL